MSKDNLSYEDLLRIVDLVETASRFSEFHLKAGDIEIDFRKRADAGAAAPLFQPAAVEPPQGGELSNGVDIAPQAPVEKTPHTSQFPADAAVVKSPMVGIFYRAREPGAKPYIEVGSRVTPETTICIIEVMKLMNSISAGASGVVTRILVEDAAPVEYEQPRVWIDPAA